MSKGSRQRTFGAEFESNFERIFGKKEPEIKARKKGGKPTQAHRDKKAEAKRDNYGESGQQ